MLSFTAREEYLALARSTTVHVAALLGIPFTRAADLRLGVDEACAVFLEPMAFLDRKSPASAGRTLTVLFESVDGQLRITVSGPAPHRQPDLEGLGWTLLRALLDEPHWEVEGAVGTLTLTEPIPQMWR